MRFTTIGFLVCFCVFTLADHLAINRKYEGYFNKAVTSYKQGNYSDAFGLIHAILNDPGEITKTDTGIFYTEDLVQDFLAGISSEGRKFYEQEYNHKAKALLKQTENAFDLAKLKTLFTHYRNTSSGFEGAQIYASYYLERGKNDYAAYLFEKLSHSKWISPEKRLLVLTKWVTALVRAGEKKKADELILEIEKEFSPDAVKFNSKKVIAWKTLKDTMFSKEVPKTTLSAEMLKQRINQLEMIKVQNDPNYKENLKAQYRVLKTETKDPSLEKFFKENFFDLYCNNLPPSFNIYATKFFETYASRTYSIKKLNDKEQQIFSDRYDYKENKTTTIDVVELRDNKGFNSIYYESEKFYVILNMQQTLTTETNVKNEHTFKTLKIDNKEKKDIYKYEFNPYHAYNNPDLMISGFLFNFKRENFSPTVDKIIFFDSNGNLKTMDKAIQSILSREITYTPYSYEITFSPNKRFAYLPATKKVIDLESQKVVPTDFIPQQSTFSFKILKIFDSGEDFIYQFPNVQTSSLEIHSYKNKKDEKILESELLFGRTFEYNPTKNLFALVNSKTAEYEIFSYDPTKKTSEKVFSLGAVSDIDKFKFTNDGERMVFFKGQGGLVCNLDF